MQNKQNNTSFQEPQPLVSFIVTYYNEPVQLLCECINSIMELSLASGKRELIVIDDGSEVSPMNALMQYGTDIIYVRQKNGGLSRARNKGIDMATGRYIQFVDADDHLMKAPYDHCLDILCKDDSLDMLMFDFTTDAADSQTAFNDHTPVSGSQYMLHNNIHGSACGYLFSRTTLGKLRFTPGIYHEDEEFTPQLLIRAEQVQDTDARAYYYYKHAGSITSHQDDANKTKRLNDRFDVLLRLRELSDRVPRTDRMALQRRIAQLTMDYIYQVIIQTHSSAVLNERIAALRGKGLFPLPDRSYSAKYTWFRKLANNALGRQILLRTLPLMKNER
jgi:glycosyltransferase involved in cell wall biosynthesis